MPEQVIHAIDPGKMTGYVRAVYDTKTAEILEYETSELDQWDICALIEEIPEGDEVAYETFTITTETAKKGQTHFSLEIIGVLKYFSQKNGFSITGDSPSAAKNFCDNPRLKALGLWHVGGAGHAKDALRHLVIYLVKNKQWKPEGLLG